MNKRTLAEVTEVVRKTFRQYDKQGTDHWDWQTAARDLSYQVGSLHKVMLQLENKRFNDKKSTKQLWDNFKDELADILSEVVYIADELDIDLDEAIDAMVASDKNKVDSRT